MRSFFCFLMFGLLSSGGALAAKRVTVQELTQILVSLHASNKPDQEVADRLKQLELSEELSSSDREALKPYLPGDLSLEQMEILRGLSAFQPPAASQIPTTPALDADGQKALLTRAGSWLSGTLTQLPTVTGSKVTFRYQDDVQKIQNVPGLRVDLPNTYSQFSEARTDVVTYTQGAEKRVSEPTKTNWGSNGQISEGGPPPSLPEIFQEASLSGKLAFARWEVVSDKPVAVFSFSVEKKKSRYNVSYCCFPDTDIATGAANAGYVIAPGQIQSVTTWKPFKKTVPYHGFVYIDPVSGAILRTVTFAELKPSDFIHTENVRIDYTPDIVGGKDCIVPQQSITVNETVPGGDAGTLGYSVRHSLFTSVYGNYRLGGAQ